MDSNLLPEVDSLPDGFVDGAADHHPEEANPITTGDVVSIKKTEKRRTFPVPLCEEETDGNEDDGDVNDLSSKLSLEQQESSSQTCESLAASQGSSQNPNKETESTQNMDSFKTRKQVCIFL